MSLRRLIARLRVWWHRWAAKWWYDEYLYHTRAAKIHRRATTQCIAKGNEYHQRALRLEAELKA